MIYSNTDLVSVMKPQHVDHTKLGSTFFFFLSALLDLIVYLVAGLFLFCSFETTSKYFNTHVSAVLEEKACPRGLLFVSLRLYLTNSFKNSCQFMLWNSTLYGSMSRHKLEWQNFQVGFSFKMLTKWV